MAKVYCKGCRHICKICVGYAESTEYHCFHDVCFKDEKKDTSFSKGVNYKGDCTVKRITDGDTLNADNNCQYFEDKYGFLDTIVRLIKEKF